MSAGRGMGSTPGAIGFAAALLILAAFTLGPAPPARGEEEGLTGVEGVAAFRGDFVVGASVLAFTDPGPDGEALPLEVSGLTDDSGRYRLPLPPGSYYLLAVKASGKSWPPPFAAGDLYCYYLGNPIVVEEGKATRVGFNMIEVRAEEKAETGKGSGVTGKVLFGDEPLGRAYVYVYRDSRSNFRGMGLAALPAGEDGRFRMKLPPGGYYLLARKRLGGGVYGPPGKNDYIGYYHGNPIEVRAGEFAKIHLETTTRVDLLEETWFTEGKGAGWFRGVVVESGGKPVPGLYVLFYQESEKAGAPAFVAGPTDEEGRFKVRAAAGRYYLLARSNLGGPLQVGEWYGTYSSKGGEEKIEMRSQDGIRLEVNPYK